MHFGQLLKNRTIRYDFIKKFIFNKKILTETGILVDFIQIGTVSFDLL